MIDVGLYKSEMISVNVTMNKINKKLNCLILSAIILASVFGLMKIGENIINVEAQLDNLVVLPFTIDYANIFPEEILQDDFTVSLSDSAKEDEKTITYKVETRQKSDNNLCEFLTIDNSEAEGDTNEESSLDPKDISDLWKVNLETPCLENYLPQGEYGKIIKKGGDYDCEIVVTAIRGIAAAKKELPSKKAVVPTGASIITILLLSFALALVVSFIFSFLKKRTKEKDKI